MLYNIYTLTLKKESVNKTCSDSFLQPMHINTNLNLHKI